MKRIALLALFIPTLAHADAITDRFVGTWKATGTLTAGKDTAAATASWTCKPTSAKAGVLCTLELKGIPGMPVYAETDLFGMEPNTKTLHWFAVTNAGETHDHVATPGEGKLQFVYAGAQEGKPFKEVIDLDMAKDGKSFALRSETFAGGVSTGVLAMKATK